MLTVGTIITKTISDFPASCVEIEEMVHALFVHYTTENQVGPSITSPSTNNNQSSREVSLVRMSSPRLDVYGYDSC